MVYRLDALFLFLFGCSTSSGIRPDLERTVNEDGSYCLFWKEDGITVCYDQNGKVQNISDPNGVLK